MWVTTAVVLAEVLDSEVPVVEAVQNGDRGAFEHLVRRHSRWVRGVVFSVLGGSDRLDDVAQQIWLSVWNRVRELRDAKRWRPWLYQLARNAAIDAGREASRRRIHARPWPENEQPAGNSATPEDWTAVREQHREVLSAIASLPELYREPFVLRHLNEWSYQEIAEVMGMPVDSVETRLVRARRLLRDALKDKIG